MGTHTMYQALSEMLSCLYLFIYSFPDVSRKDLRPFIKTHTIQQDRKTDKEIRPKGKLGQKKKVVYKAGARKYRL